MVAVAATVIAVGLRDRKERDAAGPSVVAENHLEAAADHRVMAMAEDARPATAMIVPVANDHHATATNGAVRRGGMTSSAGGGLAVMMKAEAGHRGVAIAPALLILTRNAARASDHHFPQGSRRGTRRCSSSP